MIINVSLNYRMQETERMKVVLSDFSQNVRRRTRTISIKVTIISWMVEFLTGISLVFFKVLGNAQSHPPYYMMFYLTSMCVVAPSTYLINREVIKQKILLSGWRHGIRSIFMSDKQVAPNQVHNAFTLKRFASESTRAKTSMSSSANAIAPNSSKSTAHSSNKIHTLQSKSNPKLEAATRIPVRSSTTIQPIVQPILSGNNDLSVE